VPLAKPERIEYYRLVPMVQFSTSDIRALEQTLLADGLAVIPTDTIYGLVCLASSQKAVQRLYTLKPRELKPGTVIAANVDQIINLGVKRRYIKAVEHLWPNPISIILPCTTEASYLHQGKQSLPFRIPADENIRHLLELVGPLMTTSANNPDCPPSTTIEEAKAYFHDAVDIYVDGGHLSKNQPSTIIRIVDDAIEVIREGAVKLDEYGRITDTPSEQCELSSNI
jgi:tRNA threonylcarbamoyl adenosine modification protein (Sua5/YciO/YrdC/YwlC family)